MKFEYAVQVPATPDVARRFILDVPAVAACLPGVERVEPDGEGRYRGAMKVKVGPISLTLAGLVAEERRDEAAGVSSWRAEAADRRVGGSVRATLDLEVVPHGETASEIRIRSDAQLLGKLGEFGQPLIRKKADQIFAEFGESLRKRLSESPA
ncbi:MAG: SRPBCC family protein [Dehalococcoidia bacterium]